MTDAIRSLLHTYNQSLQMEVFAEMEFIKAQDTLEYEKARVIVLAYADGSIDGKTAEVRKWQESAILGNTESVNILTQYYWDAKYHLDETQATRKSFEAEIGLNKAFMYSKAGSLIKD